MQESPFFFPSSSGGLFAVLHTPGARPSGRGYVLSHPFAEEKLWSHRVFVSLARALAARGDTVLRFDYTGAGDSQGTTLDASLETYLADLGAAIGALVERAPSLGSIGIIGLRLGAAVAALLLERDVAVPAALRHGPLVLWEPVVDGTAYFQDVMRGNLSMQLASYGKVIETREVLQARILDGGSVNVDGYEIGPSLFRSCARPDLLPLTPKAHQGPVLVVSIAPAGKQRPRQDLDALAACYPNATAVTADEQPFWREIKQFYGKAANLQALTLDWLGRRDA